MKKRMLIMLLSLGLLFGGIFAYKTFGTIMMKRHFASQELIATVSAMEAKKESWLTQQRYYGSLRAARGVNVTTELAGIVDEIYFSPGSTVKKGDVLVQLRSNSDRALLRSLEANTALAKITMDRDKAQYAIKAISKATLDADIANYESLKAQTEQQADIVQKKTILAPFSGRLGVSKVNPGQYLNSGDPIVSLQDLSVIYADFFVPQQQLGTMKIDQIVQLSIDVYPDRIFTGTITTINPIIDTNTRNVEVEATLNNPMEELIPGMFATITVETASPRDFITLPKTAISFNSYGDVVFTITENGKDKKGKPILTVQQHFVTTGDSRGDQVAILKGLKVGDKVVTSGQLKIKNGSRVVISNAVIPSNNPAPKPVEN